MAQDTALYEVRVEVTPLNTGANRWRETYTITAVSLADAKRKVATWLHENTLSARVRAVKAAELTPELLLRRSRSRARRVAVRGKR